MTRVYSNGPAKDFVINPFTYYANKSVRIFAAAPYFTMADALVAASTAGKTVDLLVGLNGATSPEALKRVHGLPNIAIRYLTRRFHAKIYIFDNCALLGSSNLTDGGLQSNREATIVLDRAEDFDTIEELKALFLELWDAAQVLTNEKLKSFVTVHQSLKRSGPEPDELIENAVGRAEPVTINVATWTKSSGRIFLEDLRRQVYEQYRPAFNEVTSVLEANQFHRAGLVETGLANHTNRFLNWVRLTYVVEDEAWQAAAQKSQVERREVIVKLGQEWKSTNDPKIPNNYIEWLTRVEKLFGSEGVLSKISKDEITLGLMSIHAFTEQLRFVKGGTPNLPIEFWEANKQDVGKVKATLMYFLHGAGDFVERLHDVLYRPDMKLGYFGRFCALELYGTIKPEECPPMNGRMAKALRFLGFNVRTA